MLKERVRNFSAYLLSSGFIWLGLCEKVKEKALRGDFIISIYFHSPSKELFKFCVEWLKQNGFIFLSEQDIIDIKEKKVSFPNGGVILTVDDGWRSNIENVVEVANEKKIPVTIFVATEPVENGNYWWPIVEKAISLGMCKKSLEDLKSLPNRQRVKIVEEFRKKVSLEREAMTVKEVMNVAASKYVTIGAHTVNHPILTNCDTNEVEYEIEESKKRLENWTKKNIKSFAYPNGNYSNREFKILKNFNFSLSFTTEPRYLTADSLEENFRIPRFCVYEGVSHKEAICRMMGVWQRYFKS